MLFLTGGSLSFLRVSLHSRPTSGILLNFGHGDPEMSPARLMVSVEFYGLLWWGGGGGFWWRVCGLVDAGILFVRGCFVFWWCVVGLGGGGFWFIFQFLSASWCCA